MVSDDFVQELARECGQIIRDGYQTIKTWRTKADPGDVVTEIDEASERHVIERIRAAFPDDGILSEECGRCVEGSNGAVWVIDPLDGTRNFTLHIPFFCVSIARAVNGVVEWGAIYDPVHDEMFHAVRGGGAYLNGEPISVSRDQTLENGLFNISWVNRKADPKRFIEYIDRLSGQTSYFRRFGSAALVMAYVACGRLHGYVQGGVNAWDVAAGIVLVEEAGGRATDFAGQPIDLGRKNIEIVTANPSIHKSLIDVVNHAGHRRNSPKTP